MPAFALLAAASAVRLASLNLCADEYALLLARPGELVSVTRLSHDPAESPLANRARKVPANRGELEQVIGQRPNVLLTMGELGRSTAMLAKRMKIRAVDLPSPTDIAGVEMNLRTVATALGDPYRAELIIDRLAYLRRSKPSRLVDAMYVSGGGTSIGSWSPASEWMRLAGLRQRKLSDGKVTLEQLLERPPQILLRSSYRSGQMSSGQAWFDHPIVRRLESRTYVTDGRPWTCAGPLMIAELERLRKLLQ
jgi:iron complex transport system substrate-binding protein